MTCSPVRLLAALALLVQLGYVSVQCADDYQLGPESTTRASGVPAGRVEKFEFAGSKVFPDTRRDCWVYIPAQYDGSKAAASMVFQDGQAYVNANGQMRVPIVFDNLIAKGDMPVTVGLFVSPGQRGEAASGEGRPPRSNRSFEYDSLGDAYARFLIEELIPFTTDKFQLNLSTDPRLNAICGMSSGGICAWTVAWERPKRFGKVLSHIGSFTNIRGGHNYPALIRKTERKPIRVFLQDGSNDLNNLHGNWPLANQEMASALAFMGYDFKFEFGDGAHNGKHGGAILPASLRWLWRPELKDLPKPLTKDNLGGDEALSKVLADGGEPGDWELVGEGYGFTDAACADSEGNFYFSDLPKGMIYRVGAGDSKPSVWLENGPKISGLKFGPDGKLYACVQGVGTNNVKRIVTIEPNRKEISTVATDVQPNDLIVSRAGWIYFTDTSAGTVARVPTSARGMSRPAPVAGGINRPNGISLSADQRELIVSEYGGTNAWSYLVALDGSLRGGEKNMELRPPVGRPDSGGDGMTTDERSRFYITSHLGIQMFDATGRMGGVISKPQDKGTVSCAFAGPDHSYLYVCSSDKVFRRKTLTKGAVFTR
ncbi:MAG: SMP-30/gluconolactonase/LRE family protein [Verrucomicrobia bacterium]|nr:SMP-30/gluconolactonase/LRE family protein [Verrucomicrobiota bacterium]